MKISTIRWTIAWFLGGVLALTLAAIPLVAYCAGAGTAAFGHAVLAALLVAAACLVVIVVTLDILGARARKNDPSRRPPRGRGLESRRAHLRHGGHRAPHPG